MTTSASEDKLETNLLPTYQKPRRGRRLKEKDGTLHSDSGLDKSLPRKRNAGGSNLVKTDPVMVEPSSLVRGGEGSAFLESGSGSGQGDPGGSMQRGLFQPGDVVWAKVPGYPYWPAEVCGTHHADGNIRVMKQKEKFLQGRMAQGREDAQLVRFFNEKDQPWLWAWPEKLVPFEENLQQMKVDALGASAEDNEDLPPKPARVPPAKKKADRRAKRREQQLLAKVKTVVPSLTVPGEEMAGFDAGQNPGGTDEVATPVGGTAEIAIQVLGTMRRGEDAEALVASNGDSFRGLASGVSKAPETLEADDIPKKMEDSCCGEGTARGEPFALRDGATISVVIPSKVVPLRRKSILLKSQEQRWRFEIAVKEAMDHVRLRLQGLVGAAGNEDMTADELGRPQKRSKMCADVLQTPGPGRDPVGKSGETYQLMSEKVAVRRGKARVQEEDSRTTSTGQDCSAEMGSKPGRKPPKPSASRSGVGVEEAAEGVLQGPGEELNPPASHFLGNRRGRGGKRAMDRRGKGEGRSASVHDISGVNQDVNGLEGVETNEQAVEAEKATHNGDEPSNHVQGIGCQLAVDHLMGHESASSSQETVQQMKQQMAERDAAADVQEPQTQFTKVQGIREVVEAERTMLELQRQRLRDAEAARDQVQEELNKYKAAVWVAAQTVDVEGGELEVALHSGQSALNAKVEEANTIVNKLEESRKELAALARRKLELRKLLAKDQARLAGLLSLECWWIAEPGTQGAESERAESQMNAEVDAVANDRRETPPVEDEDGRRDIRSVHDEAASGLDDGRKNPSVDEEDTGREIPLEDAEAVADADILNLEFRTQQRTSEQQKRWAAQKAEWASQVDRLEERIEVEVGRVEQLEADLHAAEERVATARKSIEEAERKAKEIEEAAESSGVKVVEAWKAEGANEVVAPQS